MMMIKMMMLQRSCQSWLLLLLQVALLSSGKAVVEAADDATGRRVFTSLPELDALYTASAANSVFSTTTFERQGNLNVVTQSTEHPQYQNVGICHIPEMNRHSFFAGPNRLPFPSDYPLDCMAAIALAMEHLNTGNGRVVRQVADMPNMCPQIKFTTEFMDTAGLEIMAVDQVMNMLNREPLATGNNNDTTTTAATQPPPCAFLGSFRSNVNVATALYTSLKGYTQVSTLTHTKELENRNVYSLYGSLTPSNPALPFLKFLRTVLGINHLAVLYTDTPSGRGWYDPLRLVIPEYAPDFYMVGVPYNPTQTNFTTTIQLLKETGLKYIYAITGTEEFEAIVTEAVQQGVAGTGQHTWISWAGIPTSFLLRREFTSDNPIFQTAQGMVIYDATIRSIAGVGRYEEYLAARAEIANNPQDVAYLQSKIPAVPGAPAYNPQFETSMFQNIGRWTGTASTLYDATIAMGLAACTAANGTNHFTGQAQYDAFINTTFEGTTGVLEMDPVTGTRKSTSNLYAASNMVATQLPSGNWTFAEIKTHYYQKLWFTLQDDQGKDVAITYADGSQTPLPDLPEQDVDYNYLGKGLRATGLLLASLVLVASLFCMVWTWSHSQARIVRASQPIFLLFICGGTLLMGSSLIPLSLDDEVVGEEGAGRACMSVPWLLSTGWCIVFAALFSKTHRVNVIFHNPSFRRVKVNAIDVMKPMIVFLTLNIVVLLLWTIMSPMEWEREVTSLDTYGRPIESVGQCTTDDNIWFYTGPLLAIDGGALAYSLQQAFVARKISTEFAESEWIARAMSFILLVSFVTIPVLIIAEDEPRASYFVQCALVFTICTSILGFIFLPKILSSVKNREDMKNSIWQTVRSVRKGNRKDGAETTSSQFTAGESTDLGMHSEHEGEGAMVMEHPKAQGVLVQELEKLKHRKSELEREVAELRDRSHQDGVVHNANESEAHHAAVDDDDDKAPETFEPEHASLLNENTEPASSSDEENNTTGASHDTSSPARE